MMLLYYRRRRLLVQRHPPVRLCHIVGQRPKVETTHIISLFTLCLCFLSSHRTTTTTTNNNNNNNNSFFFTGAEDEIISVTYDDSNNDDILNCPGPDEAFVTTCSGNGSDTKELKSNNGHYETINSNSPECDTWDEASTIPSRNGNDNNGFDLMGEVHTTDDGVATSLHEEDNESQQKEVRKNNDIDNIIRNEEEKERPHHQQQQQSQQKCSEGEGTHRHHQHPPTEQGIRNNNSPFATSASSTSSDIVLDNEYSAYYQLKKTTTAFVHRYYSPLDKRGKCAIGSACGFLASRVSLGVANRIFRIAGATWVFSEAIHASGLCDEKSCAVLPQEARPWIIILRRSIGQKVEMIRRLARKIWNKERIREMARQDEALASGIAAGAFLGFIV